MSTISKEVRKAITETVFISISSFRFLALAVTALFLITTTSEAQGQGTLRLLKKYDHGVSKYSEGLDFYDGFLWHTSWDSLYKLDPDSARDIDGDGDYDLTAEKTWNLNHHDHSESSVWFNGELYNFTFRDRGGNLSDDIYKLDLFNNETYRYWHVGDGMGTTNWGSCRDRRNPGEFIIYTGHYDDLLMWYDPYTGNTTWRVKVTGLDAIEDLGMDRYGAVWASSVYSSSNPGLYKIDPDTGKILGTFYGPVGLDIIDGIAIRSIGKRDVMYVTGKNTQYIWEYQIPMYSTKSSMPSEDRPVPEALVLYPNYPNPFNSITIVSFMLASDADVNLIVFNEMGQKVRTLINERRPSGINRMLWNGMNDSGKPVRSGLYLFRITVRIDNKEYSETNIGILLK